MALYSIWKGGSKRVNHCPSSHRLFLTTLGPKCKSLGPVGSLSRAHCVSGEASWHSHISLSQAMSLLLTGRFQIYSAVTNCRGNRRLLPATLGVGSGVDKTHPESHGTHHCLGLARRSPDCPCQVPTSRQLTNPLQDPGQKQYPAVGSPRTNLPPGTDGLLSKSPQRRTICLYHHYLWWEPGTLGLSLRCVLLYSTCGGWGWAKGMGSWASTLSSTKILANSIGALGCPRWHEGEQGWALFSHCDQIWEGGKPGWGESHRWELPVKECMSWPDGEISKHTAPPDPSSVKAGQKWALAEEWCVWEPMWLPGTLKVPGLKPALLLTGCGCWGSLHDHSVAQFPQL